MSVGQNVSYFRSRPYKEVKGNHPRRHISKILAIRRPSDNWNGLLAIEGGKGQIIPANLRLKNVCLPSNFWTTFFYISQRPWCFLFCMFHVFDVQDMETFNVAAQNFVSEAGSENGISEWAEKIMDPVGVSWEFPPE